MAALLEVQIRGDLRALGATGERLRAAARRGTERAGKIVERAVGKRFTGYQPGRRGGDLIQRRSGHLRQSLNSEVHATANGGAEARVGYRKGDVDKYAAQVEYGGTITARGRLLAIPFAAGLTAAGVAKYRSPRDVPGGFWLTRPGLTPLFVVKAGGPRSERMDMLFYGTKSVTTTGRHSLSKGLEDSRADVNAAYQSEIGKAIGQSFGA